MRALLKEAPDTPLAQTVRKQLARQVARRKPWHVGASVAYGYNDNVLGVPSGDVLPADVTTSQSHFVAYGVSGRYDWRITPKNILSSGYVLNGSAYDDVGEADFMDHLFYLDYAQGVRSNVEVGGRLGYDRLFIDGDSLRQEFALRPYTLWQPVAEATIELAYRFAYSEYFTTPTDVNLDRDSQSHSLSVTGRYTIADLPLPDAVRFGDAGALPLRLRFGLSGTNNNADGQDFDYNSYSLAPGVDVSLPHDVMLELSLHTRTHYANDNSLARLVFPH